MAEPKFDFDFTGRIVVIEPTKEYGQSAFKKRVIVVDSKDVGSDYPNPVPFTLTKDKCEKADRFSVGQTVRVRGWFNGREWFNEKKQLNQYFVDNMIGYLDKVDESSDGVTGQSPQPQVATSHAASHTAEEMPDDIPF